MVRIPGGKAGLPAGDGELSALKLRLPGGDGYMLRATANTMYLGWELSTPF